MKRWALEEITEKEYSASRWSEIFSQPVDAVAVKGLNTARRAALYWVFDEPGYTTIFDREKEWDFCCVLDACRYDIFQKVNPIEGKLSRIISPGYNTTVWSKATFTKPHFDTMFISANPKITDTLGSDYMTRNFFHHEKVWKGLWDGYYRSVLPEVMNEEFIRLRKKYPDKKAVIFYLQPHAPFLVNSNLCLRREPLMWSEHDPDERRRRMGEIYEAYRDNLRYVLREVKKLTEEVEGRFVITADHGEGFGEYGVAWEHKDTYLPWLVQVPWLEVGK